MHCIFRPRGFLNWSIGKYYVIALLVTENKKKTQDVTRILTLSEIFGG
jgi:hypothetical protein